MAKIIAFAGSTRRDSLNQKLLDFAVGLAREQGADVTLVDLKDYEMPLYNGDLEQEQGIPDAANKLYELMKDHEGLLLACPEYNSSITPLLKNTIDWVSRPRAGDAPLAAFTGKVAGLLSASPGALGGMRGLVHVRSILGNIGVFVIPNQATVPSASKAFNEAGQVTDENLAGRIKSVVEQLVKATDSLG